MTLLEDLQKDIAGGRSIVVVGTGISVATTKTGTASWIGLLRAGRERAASLGLLGPQDGERIDGLLRVDSDSDELLLAADRIVRAMGGPRSGAFGTWLREDVGYLSSHIASREAVEAIGALELPILTTNYDDILEKVLGRGYVTWHDTAQVQRVMNDQSDDVLHLHGHWKYPDSVILTGENYEQMLADRSLSALRQAMVASNSLIFVGYGEGLSDPTFGRLRDWISETLPFQELKHYRLCREKELVSLQQLHAGEAIWPISYGASHEELAPFLEGLKPSPSLVALSPVESAFALIEEQVRENAVLGTHIPGADEARIGDLLVPPVLLPAASEELLVTASKDSGGRVERCDPHEEAGASHLIISGEEYSGVTSALLWLCGEMYWADNTLIPLTIDYLQLTSGRTPLRRQVLKELRRLGRSLSDSDPLPRLILVLDNVDSVNPTRLQRVANELQAPEFERVLIGCRVGNEAQVAAHLNQGALNFRLRFIGRLARADVKQLASLVDPSRSGDLTKQAAELVEHHDLPSTPFTLSMILSVLLRGDSLMAASSPTSLLDSYVDLMLGRGTVADDSRYGLDSVNRSHILARLAETFVRRRAGSLTEIDVLAQLTIVLDEYGWTGQASEILHDFRQRRILVLRERDVEFAQSSYLYLFAAKRAEVSPDFLQLLTDDALYFAPILAHYSALRRSDFGTVFALVPGLLRPFLDLDVPRSRLFQVDDNLEQEPDPTESELEERFKREVTSVPDEDEDEDDLAPIGRAHDRREVAFPLRPVDEEPTLSRAMVTLGLSSNMLRDTDIVENQSQRREIFTDILRTYAKFVDMLESDEVQRSVAREVASEVARSMHVKEKRIAKFTDDVARILPLTVALAGVSGTLSSAKSNRLIETSLAEDSFVDDAALVIFANHILFEVHDRGWTKALDVLDTHHGRVLAVRDMIQRMMWFAFVRRPQAPSDENRLQNFLVDQALLNAKGSPPELSRRKGRAIEALKRAKLIASRTSLPGELPIGGPLGSDDDPSS